jgi:hypothetical protein
VSQLPLLSRGDQEHDRISDLNESVLFVRCLRNRRRLGRRDIKKMTTKQINTKKSKYQIEKYLFNVL